MTLSLLARAMGMLRDTAIKFLCWLDPYEDKTTEQVGWEARWLQIKDTTL